MSLKRVLGICAVVVLVFVLNQWIVNGLTNDILRAKVLRFQLTCGIVCFAAFMSWINWIYLADVFDHGRNDSVRNKDKPKESVFFVGRINWRELSNWKQYPVKAALWRGFLVCVTVLTFCSYTSFSFLIATHPSPLAFVMFLSFALTIQLFFAQIVILWITFCIKYCKVPHASEYRYSRFTRMLVILYGICVVSTGFFNTFKAPIIKEVKIPVVDLPMDRLTITFISDIHLGPTVGKNGLDKVVDMVNTLHSDVVIIGGDLVDGYVTDLHEAVESLESIRSRHGVYFVTGNHEYYTADVHNWFNKLESLGVVVLHNSNVKLHSPSGDTVCLAGVDDLQAEHYRFMDHKVDLDKALESCDLEWPVILIAHQPAVAPKAIESEYRTDLILSGHTHGGQMFPLTIFAYLFNPYYAGLYSFGDNGHVYVSMGTLYWAMPVRFGTQMEITHITLVPSY